MPPIWFTGISHSLNSAPSISCARSRKQQIAAGLLLVGQSRGIDRCQPHQEVCSVASQSLKAFTEKSLILSL